MIGQEIDGEFDFPFKTIPLKRSANKFKRYFLNVLQVFFHGLRANADVYHLHDPELLIVAVAFRFLGKKVIFDSHEDYYEKLKSKHLPLASNHMIGFIWGLFEHIASRYLSHVIVADSYTLKRFPASRSTVIANYAPTRIMVSVTEERKDREGVFKIVYVGGVSSNRGIEKIHEALQLLNDSRIEFHIAGPISGAGLKEKVKDFSHTTYHGVISWEDAVALVSNCNLGVALLQPVSAYLYYTHENMVKIYEYMALGLPVLISDFPNLKSHIESIDCGIAVDATSPQAIAKAIVYLKDNPEVCKRMGDNGKRAFLEKYNWESEERKLIDLYAQLLSS